jgi:hypothetical protein
MSGASAKRDLGTGDKSASSGRTHSRESAHKHKEESSSSIKSHRMGDKKKKMMKVVYYETDSSSPSISGNRPPLLLSHPALRNKARCISYMRQEDNIYNNIVYRDKCHKTSEYYYIAEVLLQNKR